MSIYDNTIYKYDIDYISQTNLPWHKLNNKSL